MRARTLCGTALLILFPAAGLTACGEDDANGGTTSAGGAAGGSAQTKGGAAGTSTGAKGGAAGSGASAGSSAKAGSGGGAGAGAGAGAGNAGSSGANTGGANAGGANAGGANSGGAASGGAGQAGAAQTGGSAQGGGAQAGKGGAAGMGQAGTGSAGNAGASGSGTVPPTNRALFGPLVGINGFIDDPIDVLEAAGSVREYHNWAWCEGTDHEGTYPGYPNNQNKFSLWGGFWDFDAFYGKLRGDGREVFPAIQGGVPWLANGAAPPVAPGKTATDPAAYVAHADHLYQYAARYGNTKVDAKNLKLASNQKATTGAGLLRYYEDWNEQDAWWVKPDGSPVFSAAVYAAMASADRDGHQGKLGKTLGVKNADPAAKLVMGGLAGKGDGDAWVSSITGYLDGVQKWANENRGGDFPADVVNVHYYCFGGGVFGDPNPPPAKSPEACGLEATLAKVRAYRDTKLAGKELWLTEVGYDTWPTSNLRAPQIGDNGAETVQAQWLVRSLFAIAKSGFDRGFLYTSRDEDCAGNDCAVQFKTSGLATKKGDWKKKPAWYFVNTVRARLATMGFVAAQESGNAAILVYRFRDPQTGKGALAVWANTSTAAKHPGFAVTLPAETKAAKLVQLADKQANGVETALTVTGGKVTLEVTETPSLVLLE